MTKQNETKSASKKQKSCSSVRISKEDWKLLYALRSRVKSKPGVGKVSTGEIVSVALRLFGDVQIRELQERAVTAKHKKEQLRQKYIARRGPISPKDFDELMMTAEYAEFLLELRKSEEELRITA